MNTYNTNTIINNYELNKYFEYFELSEYLQIDAEITETDLIEIIDIAILQQTIVYFTNAIKYLEENDSSLKLSLELASDLNYTTDKLDSELLATILLQDKLFNMIHDFMHKLNNF